MLKRLPDAEPTVNGDERSDHDGRRTSPQTLGPAELVADDRDLAQRRVEQPVTQLRVVLQDETEDGRRDDQQRKDRDERVVRQDGRQVWPVVVEVLVDHGDRKPDDPMPPLIAVDVTHPAAH
jgi:hypothetical protein